MNNAISVILITFGIVIAVKDKKRKSYENYE